MSCPDQAETLILPRSGSLNLSEGLDVEIKNWLNGLKSNDDKSKLAKEIIALANSGGGRIYIGFDDKGDKFPEIQPQKDELNAFTQDSIASVVNRYVTPPCQCSVSYHQQKDSTISHPVISVPGGHRVPVWAKRGSSDNKTLRSETIYIRRPGGASEPPRTQDDWEKLLDRLVRARQDELLVAIRDVLNPPQVVIPPEDNLYQWDNMCLRLWTDKINVLQESDARRNKNGYWTVSFQIDNFNRPSLATLKKSLATEMPTYSGWPPFTYLEFAPRKPSASGDEIEAWLAESHSVDELVNVDDRADYWRVSNRGKGFLLRPMQEDRTEYLSNIFPRPARPYFSWTLPIYRMSEVLKFVEALAEKFADKNSQFSLLLNYYGTNDRQLVHSDFNYILFEGAKCSQSKIESSLNGNVSQIGLNLAELVFTLLTPIYEQFDFTELPRALVNSVVQEVMSN